jgi:hypothetical protein
VTTDRDYWVVTCKNTEFHREKNPFAGHRIPLAEAEPHAEHPRVIDHFVASCDECGVEYPYEGRNVFKWTGKPVSFAPHPQFT